ncbi:MAG: gluconate 2-dehydrogenase subunit 3 family protein [Bdellovibrio sp.]|nr:gluconate 2-dehydrogenase subunit 3 family protein [Bdellovibrio sp.]
MNNKIQRRDFLKAGGSLFLLSGMSTLPTSLSAAGPSGPNPYSDKLFIALYDTIIPGIITDSTGTPGALEAGTVDFLTQTERSQKLPIPVGLIRSYLRVALNLKALWRYQKSFVHLNLEQRTEIAKRVEYLPGIPLVYRLIRAPFYTGAINRVGYDYLGYPGANRGYPDHSFKMAISNPHSRVIDGNLP